MTTLRSHVPFGAVADLLVGTVDVLDVDVFAVDVAGVGRRRALFGAASFHLVRLGVFGKVIGAHEALAAVGTREALLARVRAQVPLQLVGTREALAAKEPLTAEGPFAGVPSQVSLQVRRLAVHLTAARHVAQVLLFLVPYCSSPRVLF